MVSDRGGFLTSTENRFTRKKSSLPSVPLSKSTPRKRLRDHVSKDSTPEKEQTIFVHAGDEDISLDCAWEDTKH